MSSLHLGQDILVGDPVHKINGLGVPEERDVAAHRRLAGTLAVSLHPLGEHHVPWVSRVLDDLLQALLGVGTRADEAARLVVLERNVHQAISKGVVHAIRGGVDVPVRPTALVDEVEDDEVAGLVEGPLGVEVDRRHGYVPGACALPEPLYVAVVLDPPGGVAMEMLAGVVVVGAFVLALDGARPQLEVENFPLNRWIRERRAHLGGGIIGKIRGGWDLVAVEGGFAVLMNEGLIVLVEDGLVVPVNRGLVVLAEGELVVLLEGEFVILVESRLGINHG